jgi:GT2 family glycosyltransferase
MCTFTIVIPVKKFNDHLRESVKMIKFLERESWELYIVTDFSSESEWPQDARIQILESGTVGPAIKRDLAAQVGKGEYLLFLDDDSYPQSNLLIQLVKTFEDQDVIAVGGPGITPPNDGFWEKVSGATFESRWVGSDPERYLSIGRNKVVYDWPSVNLSVRRDVFLNIGGFGSKYWPGEDTEFCAKLARKNLKMVYNPLAVVFHHRRSGLRQHLRQIGAYGLHRGFFVRKFPENSLRLKYFLPSIFCFYLTSLFILFLSNTVNNVVLIPLYLYFFALLNHFFITFKRHGFMVAFLNIPHIFTTHYYYGVKFLIGLLFTQELESKLRR